VGHFFSCLLGVGHRFAILIVIVRKLVGPLHATMDAFRQFMITSILYLLFFYLDYKPEITKLGFYLVLNFWFLNFSISLFWGYQRCLRKLVARRAVAIGQVQSGPFDFFRRIKISQVRLRSSRIRVKWNRINISIDFLDIWLISIDYKLFDLKLNQIRSNRD
jgi:hypothetical protein